MMPKNKKKPGSHPRYQKQNTEEVDSKEEESCGTEETKCEEVNSGATFARRKIVNNWAKYEQQITFDDTSQQPEDHNSFAQLLQNPSSDNSYFQLAAEKEWENQDLKPEENLFSLDLKRLSAGLACLPFYERIGIDSNLLNPDFVKSCDSEAKKNLLKYKPTLDSHRAKLKEASQNNISLLPATLDEIKIEQKEKPSESPILSSPVPPITENLSSNDSDSVDIKSTNIKRNANKPLLGSDEDDDLEDWLDSVLDK